MPLSATPRPNGASYGGQEPPAHQPHQHSRQDFSSLMRSLQHAGDPQTRPRPACATCAKQKLGRVHVDAPLPGGKGVFQNGAALPPRLSGETRVSAAPGNPRGAEVLRRLEEKRDEPAIEPNGVQRIGDPLARVLALAPSTVHAEPAMPNAQPAMVAPEWARLLRRFAWGESRGRAVAQLEFGVGELEGATLTIESGAGGISLSLRLPPGAPASDWAERFAQRLTRRGIEVEGVSVE